MSIQGIPCSLDKDSDYPPTHQTAKQNCPVCGESLGYGVPLIAYGTDSISHAACVVSYQEDDMSFVCQKCQKVQPAHSKPNRVVLERYPVSPSTLTDGSINARSGQIKREADYCDECARLKEEPLG